MWNEKVFFEMMLNKVPELCPFYEEHLADNDELLPHVFMRDVTRFIVDLQNQMLQSKSEKVEKVVSKLFTLFEDAMNYGNSEVQNLVAVSFLENLESDNPSYSVLKSKFGQKLLEDLSTIEAFFGR